MRALQQTIKHWGHIACYAHVPHNEKEYETLLGFVDELMDFLRYHEDDDGTSLLNLIASNIEVYENRRYPAKKVSSTEMLRFLMNEHQLGQDDLPEIGSQSLVSKILNGERHLTLEHVRDLSKRFSVSPAVFF